MNKMKRLTLGILIGILVLTITIFGFIYIKAVGQDKGAVTDIAPDNSIDSKKDIEDKALLEIGKDLKDSDILDLSSLEADTKEIDRITNELKN